MLLNVLTACFYGCWNKGKTQRFAICLPSIQNCTADPGKRSPHSTWPLRNRLIKELRIHIISLLSKETKKLRLSQSQTKKLARKWDSVLSPMTPVSQGLRLKNPKCQWCRSCLDNNSQLWERACKHYCLKQQAQLLSTSSLSRKRFSARGSGGSYGRDDD